MAILLIFNIIPVKIKSIYLFINLCTYIYNTLSMHNEGDVFAVSSKGKRLDRYRYGIKGLDLFM